MVEYLGLSDTFAAIIQGTGGGATKCPGASGLLCPPTLEDYVFGGAMLVFAILVVLVGRYFDSERIGANGHGE